LNVPLGQIIALNKKTYTLIAITVMLKKFHSPQKLIYILVLLTKVFFVKVLTFNLILWQRIMI